MKSLCKHMTGQAPVSIQEGGGSDRNSAKSNEPWKVLPAANTINPWHACAVRVTVLGLWVCLSVCLSVFKFSVTTRKKSSREPFSNIFFLTSTDYHMLLYLTQMGSHKFASATFLKPYTMPPLPFRSYVKTKPLHSIFIGTSFNTYILDNGRS